MPRIEISTATTTPSRLGRPLMSDHNFSGRLWATAALIAVPFAARTGLGWWLPPTRSSHPGHRRGPADVLGNTRLVARALPIGDPYPTRPPECRRDPGDHGATGRRTRGPRSWREHLRSRHRVGHLAGPHDVERFGEPALLDHRDLLSAGRCELALRLVHRRCARNRCVQRARFLSRPSRDPLDPQRVRVGGDDDRGYRDHNCPDRPPCPLPQSESNATGPVAHGGRSPRDGHRKRRRARDGWRDWTWGSTCVGLRLSAYTSGPSYRPPDVAESRRPRCISSRPWLGQESPQQPSSSQ
jgi:hypothetical protein